MSFSRDPEVKTLLKDGFDMIREHYKAISHRIVYCYFFLVSSRTKIQIIFLYEVSFLLKKNNVPYDVYFSRILTVLLCLRRLNF